MSAAWLIAKRELGAYFKAPLGYIVAAAVLLGFGLIFQTWGMGTISQESKFSAEVLTDFFYYSAGLVMFTGVLLCFRVFAEERQLNTMILLDTAPIKEWQIVLGKFISAYVMVCGVTLLSFYMPLLVMVEGKVSFGHVVAGYVGLFALAAPVVAIGVFSSSLANNQVVAALVGAGLVLIFVLFYFIVLIAEPPIKGIFSYLDLYFEHFGPTFSRGILKTTDFIYYGTLSFVFLAATTKVLAARRWAG